MSTNEREQIDKRHQFTQMMIYPLLSQEVGKSAHEDRGQLLTWLRERDEQLASLQRELARFQRADVPELVAIAQRMVDEAPRSSGWLTCQDMIDICRQQAAEIERLKTERPAVDLELPEGDGRSLVIHWSDWKEGRLHLCVAIKGERPQDVAVRAQLEHARAVAADRLLAWHGVKQGLDKERSRSHAWKRCAKKWRHDHKIDTDRLYREAADLRVRLAEFEDAPTDKHERCEPFEEFEGLALADDDKARVITTLCRTALTLSHLNASRVISRSDNNKLFEITWSLLAFAENVLNNYGGGGLWLCVHCIIAHAASEERCGTCGTERHEWDQKPTTELSKEVGGLPAPKEAYRPGLPPVALRLVCREWEASDGKCLYFSKDGTGYRWGTYPEYFCDGQVYRDIYDEDFACKPLNKRWSEVEQEAAKALGAEDAKAGRERKTFEDVLNEVRADAVDDDLTPYIQYREAYNATRGGE